MKETHYVKVLFLHAKDTCSPASYHGKAVEYAEKEVNKRAKVLKNSVPL